MLKVGLTGGVASGKSTVAAEFARLGVPVIDADRIARQQTEPESRGFVALGAALGDEFLDEHGKLDRARMRRRLFADAGLRRKVEAVLHPLVLEDMARELTRISAPYCVAMVPLLIEVPAARALVDRVLVVDCDDATQRARLMSRDRVDESLARAMVASQLDRGRRAAAGDDILINEGGLKQLQDAVHRLHAFYLELAAQHNYRRAGLRLP